MGSEAWLPDIERHLGSYVYLLVDPRDGRVFYVGKGEGGRCFQHLAEARATRADSRGDYTKLQTIREIEASGRVVRIDILRHGLTPEEALVVESAAIDLLGLDDLVNRVRGQHSRDLGRTSVDAINARYGAKPVVIDPADKVVIIRPRRQFREGMTDDEAYRATRWAWIVGASRRTLGGPHAPDLAFTVHDGVVRAVWRITGWHAPTARELKQDPGAEGRWAFEGYRDTEAESRYLLGDVTACYRHGLQNPLVYVNC